VKQEINSLFSSSFNVNSRDWRKLYNEELHNMHSSPNIIRMIKSRKMGGICSTHGELRNSYKILVGKPEGKPFGKPGCRSEDSIRIDLKKIGCGLDSAGLGKGPVVGSCEHSNEPSGTKKGEGFYERLSAYIEGL
jgi:hypothetical protein